MTDKEEILHKGLNTGQIIGKNKKQVVNHPHDMGTGIVHLFDQNTEQTGETRTAAIGTKALGDITTTFTAKTTIATLQETATETGAMTLTDEIIPLINIMATIRTGLEEMRIEEM
jgi:hypothetical protein